MGTALDGGEGWELHVSAGGGAKWQNEKVGYEGSDGMQGGGGSSKMAGARRRSRSSLRRRMDNLRRDQGGELAVSHFDKFCTCVRDLGEENKTWIRIH